MLWFSPYLACTYFLLWFEKGKNIPKYCQKNECFSFGQEILLCFCCVMHVYILCMFYLYMFYAGTWPRLLVAWVAMSAIAHVYYIHVHILCIYACCTCLYSMRLIHVFILCMLYMYSICFMQVHDPIGVYLG